MPEEARLVNIQRYGVGGLHWLPEDVPANGYSVVIMPFGTMAQQTYAREAPGEKSIFDKQLAGWVCGASPGFSERPQVFYGMLGHCIDDEVVAMHFELAEGYRAQVKMINIFEMGDGDRIEFPSDGFSSSQAFVNGRSVVFSEYLLGCGVEYTRPLLCNVHGLNYNVTIRDVDKANSLVSFYAPIFKNTEYRFARPLRDMRKSIERALPKLTKVPAFCCGCISLYELGHLENFKAGLFSGPISHGEIANILVNQTFTYITVDKA
jgi:hypothetical protein